MNKSKWELNTFNDHIGNIVINWNERHYTNNSVSAKRAILRLVLLCSIQFLSFQDNKIISFTQTFRSRRNKVVHDSRYDVCPIVRVHSNLLIYVRCFWRKRIRYKFIYGSQTECVDDYVLAWTKCLSCRLHSVDWFWSAMTNVFIFFTF